MSRDRAGPPRQDYRLIPIAHRQRVVLRYKVTIAAFVCFWFSRHIATSISGTKSVGGDDAPGWRRLLLGICPNETRVAIAYVL